MSSRPMRWSECECVKRMKSSRGIGSRSSCRRRSGVVSMRKNLPFVSIFADCLRRLFRGSPEEQMLQLQPTTGTPVEVPVPRKVTIIEIRISNFEFRIQNEETVESLLFLILHSKFEIRNSKFRFPEMRTLPT